MNKVRPVICLGLLLCLPLAAVAQSDDVEKGYEAAKNYKEFCRGCHQLGLRGSPRTGDVAAWESRLSVGIETVLDNVRAGVNKMPSMGNCQRCSDQELRALIVYMSDVKNRVSLFGF